MAGDALADATALILAGGFGTRLRSAIGDLPKFLADVGGVPFGHHLLRGLARFGVRRAVLCTGHRGDVVRATLGELTAGVRLRYSRETEPLGTGGALRHALAQVTSRTVVVVNGDSLSDTDLAELWRFHHAHAAKATIALASCADPRRYGRVEIDADWRGSRFAEKDPDATAQRAWINAGLYLLAADLIAGFPTDRAGSLEAEVLPSLVRGALFGFPGAQRFLDIGVPRAYATAEAFVRDLYDVATRPARPATRGVSK